MASIYKYEPLAEDGSIRLLKLLPGSLQTPLQGALITVSLSDPKIHFDALSYCWGNPFDEAHLFCEPFDIIPHEILINGSGLRIKQNLYEALLQMRDHGEYLWADAICIDQSNKTEKTRQIMLMREIYFKANSVIVWLGKSDETSDEAIQVIENCKEDAFLYLMSMPTSSYAETMDEIAFITPLSASQRIAVANFFLRTWFSRVWTLQEVLLTNKAIGYCGTTTLIISDAALLAAALVRSEVSISSKHLVSTPEITTAIRQVQSAALIGAYVSSAWCGGGFSSRALFRYPRIDHKMQVSRTDKWLIALELLVDETRSRCSTEARDKIIAPLTCAMHSKFIPDSGIEKFGIGINKILDLDQSPISTYCNFTAFMIDSMRSLDILSRIDRRCLSNNDEDVKTPSWVPNFNSTGTTSLIDNLLMYKFNASNSAAHYQISNQPQSLPLKLKVKAVFFGNIEKISSYWARCDQIVLWLKLVSEKFEGKRSDDLVTSKESQCGCDGIGSEDDIAFLAIKWFPKTIIQGQKLHTTAVASFNEYLRYHLGALTLAELGVKVHEQRKRRFFMSGPRPFGLAPMLAQQGDFICILHGAKVPFVLRLLPGRPVRYSLIGEAYLDSFMHGQISYLNLPVQTVVLV